MTDPTGAAKTGEILPPDAPAVCPDRWAPPRGGSGARGRGPGGRAGGGPCSGRRAAPGPHQHLPAELIAVMDGALADAVAVAADYAGDSITAATRAAYLGDWAEFAAWCRTQQVDPTALPIHPVLVAAYLATLAEKIGRSALRRRVAAIYITIEGGVSSGRRNRWPSGKP